MFSQKKIKPHDELMSRSELVLKIIREKMMSSHRIISRIAFPEIRIEIISNIVAAIGANKALAYLNYQNNLRTLRHTSQQCVDLSHVSLSDILAINVAVASLGVGECEEHAALTAYELLKLDAELIVQWVTLKMGCGDEHHIILLGNSTSLKKDTNISTFNELDDECIFIDPFLHIAGKANCMQILTGDYLSANKCTHISACYTLTTSTIDLPNLTNKINYLRHTISEKLEAFKFHINKHIEYALELFFSIDDPFCRFMKTVKQLCDKTINGPEIFAASLESLPLAFHKACAYGELDLVTLILQDQTASANIDLNEASPNGYTALDWAHTITDNPLKEQMIAKLEAHGALTSEQKTKQPSLGR